MPIEAVRPQNEAWYRGELAKDIAAEQDRWVSDLNQSILELQKSYFKSKETGVQPTKNLEFCYAKIDDENIRDYVNRVFSEAGWKVEEDGAYLRFALYESIEKNLLAPRESVVNVVLNGRIVKVPLQVTFKKIVSLAGKDFDLIDELIVKCRRFPMDTEVRSLQSDGTVLTVTEGMLFDVYCPSRRSRKNE